MTRWGPAHITSIQATVSVTPAVNDDQAFLTATTSRSKIQGMRLSTVTSSGRLQFHPSDHLGMVWFGSGKSSQQCTPLSTLESASACEPQESYRPRDGAKDHNVMERLWHIMELVFSLLRYRSG